MAKYALHLIREDPTVDELAGLWAQEDREADVGVLHELDGIHSFAAK